MSMDRYRGIGFEAEFDPAVGNLDNQNLDGSEGCSDDNFFVLVSFEN